MRFFRPVLAPSALQPMKYTVLSGVSLESITIARDLTSIRIQCKPELTRRKINEIHAAINAELVQFPYRAPCRFDCHALEVTDLLDVGLAMTTVKKILEHEDSAFFDKMDAYLEKLYQGKPELNAPYDFLDSPERLQYFSLNALRQSGVQHAVELPLNVLKERNYLSEGDFNTMRLDTLLTVSEMRREKREQDEKEKAPFSP